MNIPENDTQQLWQQSGHKWSDLVNTLKEDKNSSAQGIGDKRVDYMYEKAQQKEQSGAEFPQSANELNKVMNK